MKKTKLLALSLCAVTLLVTGCKNPGADVPPVSKTIDFRNKAKDGTVFAGRSVRAAGDDTALTQEFLGVSRYAGYEFTGLTDEEVGKIITFEDSAAGLKVVFNTPESYKGKQLYQLDMILEDENGNWSTGVSVDKSVIADNLSVAKESFSFEYPLVYPDVSQKFHFQVYFEGTNGQWSYSVTPKHGKARVDALPKGYVDENYCSYKDGLISLNDVIPPEAQEVSKEATLRLKKEGQDKWSSNGDRLISIKNKLEDYGQKNDAYIGDISNIDIDGNPVDMSEYPYFFVTMQYKYKLKNYDLLTFSSPNLSSKVYENNFFNKAEADRTVSNTKMTSGADGITVSFDGDGYFDGLYEGDIAVKYESEDFIPAVFVSGLDVYILEVNNGEYTAKTKKPVSEYLKEGGSFGNTDNNTVYAKMKTDSSSEANLDKSDKKEILVKGTF